MCRTGRVSEKIPLSGLGPRTVPNLCCPARISLFREGKFLLLRTSLECLLRESSESSLCLMWYWEDLLRGEEWLMARSSENKKSV